VLRFTVHQPSQHRASPRSHDTPCRDVPRRIHISITGIRAGHATEESLALATLRPDMPTHRTTLTRERRTDSFHPPRGLVLQASGERRPRGIEDRPVQARLLRHVASGLLDGAPRRADHIRHPQILDPDQVVPSGGDHGGLLHEVPAPIRCARMQSRQPSLRSPTSVGAASAPRQCACRFPDTHRWRGLIGGAIGQGQRDDDTTIDTRHAAVARPLQRCGNHRESDVPTTRRIQRHPVGLPVRQVPAAPQPHPANLRHRDPRPTPIEPLHPQSSRANDTETLMPSPFTPVRSPMGTAPPVRHRLGKIPQRLLLHRLRTRPQPLVGGPSLGQLLALHHIVRQRLTMMPVSELFHRQVPHEPGVRAMLREQHFLLLGRIQAKPHNRRPTVLPDNSGFPHTRKGGVSTRDSR
jgi:hypothetical protein